MFYYMIFHMSINLINKKALYDYELLSRFEFGLELFGHEVKSIRSGHCNLKGSYVSIRNDELWWINGYVASYYKAGTLPGYDPYRARRLLAHKREIRQLIGSLSQKGLTLIVLKVYSKANRLKIECALAKGKKKHDKRQSLKEKDVEREIRRVMKTR